MKNRFLILLLLVTALLCGLFTTATAAENPLKFEMELSSTRFSAPAEVTVTIRVTNTADTDMPGPMAIYDPDGKMIEEFGTPTLAAGQSKTWTGTWFVTQDQIDTGAVAFGTRFTVLGDDGLPTREAGNYYVRIENAGAVAQVKIDRTITPSMASKGQKVSVIYTVSNLGTIDVTDVEIKESSAVSKSVGKIDLVKAGETVKHTFTVTMGTKNLTSNAKVTYKAGGREYTETIGNATIKYGNVKLSASLKADKKGGAPGETVKLTLTLKNTGKSDYQNVTVSDANLGTLFSGLTVKAGETVTQEKEITISQSADYQFVVTGTDASGTTIETATDAVSVVAVDPTKNVSLQVSASVDKPMVYMLPDVVTFTVNVTNTSAVEATDVTVSATGVDLYHFDVIPAGATKTFVRDVRIEMAGSFRFDARTKDQLGANVTFMSDLIRISRTSPTPTPSQVPMPTPQMPDMEDIPTDDGLPAYVDTLQSVLGIAKWVCLGIAVVGIVLILVGIIGRGTNAAKSSNASDHLQRDGYRSYIETVSPKKRHTMPEEARDNDADDDSAESVAAPEAEPEAPAEQEAPTAVADAMAELYPDADKGDQGDNAQTYQRRRRSDD